MNYISIYQYINHNMLGVGFIIYLLLLCMPLPNNFISAYVALKIYFIIDLLYILIVFVINRNINDNLIIYFLTDQIYNFIYVLWSSLIYHFLVNFLDNRGNIFHRTLHYYNKLIIDIHILYKFIYKI